MKKENLIKVILAVIFIFITIYGWQDWLRARNKPEVTPVPAETTVPAENSDKDILTAIEEGDMERVKQLIKENPDMVNLECNQSGSRPLHIAVYKNHKEIALLLIEKGADVNSKDVQGTFPLYAAVCMENKEMVSLLIDNGADVNIEPDGTRRPLDLAASTGNKEIVTLLIEKGAEINAESQSGSTALTCAISEGHDEIVNLLIEYGADVKTGAPLLIAANPFLNATKNPEKIVALLIEKGADVNVKNDYGNTPLICAAYAEGDINIQSRGFSSEILKLLLKNGAYVNASDKFGNTVLHKAVLYHNKEQTILLIDHGANINAVNLEGKTPLDMAKKMAADGYYRDLYEEMRDLLLKYGAKGGNEL